MKDGSVCVIDKDCLSGSCKKIELPTPTCQSESTCIPDSAAIKDKCNYRTCKKDDECKSKLCKSLISGTSTLICLDKTPLGGACTRDGECVTNNCLMKESKSMTC